MDMLSILIRDFFIGYFKQQINKKILDKNHPENGILLHAIGVESLFSPCHCSL